MKRSDEVERLRGYYPDLTDQDINLIIESKNATFDGILPEKAETKEGFRILSRMASEAYHEEECAAGLF